MFTFTLETAPLIPDINSSLATFTSHNDGTYPSKDKNLAIFRRSRQFLATHKGISAEFFLILHFLQITWKL